MVTQLIKVIVITYASVQQETEGLTTLDHVPCECPKAEKAEWHHFIDTDNDALLEKNYSYF